MAPTRRSQANAALKSTTRKPTAMALRAPSREQSDSWELLQREDDDDAMDQDEEMDDLLLGGAEAAKELQSIADRVGKEVESFAESLDKFFEDLPTTQSPFEDLRQLVDEFKDIADDRVEELGKAGRREWAEDLRREWGVEAGFKATLSTDLSKKRKRSSKVEELRAFQEEADTWDLFLIVLEMHHGTESSAQKEERKRREFATMGNVHRYTSENELWERFLLDDDLARERATIKDWLERSAEHQRSGVEGIMEELETRAGTGAGLWSKGWMHSREKIKAEKRMRTWPQPDSSPLPQIRRDNNELLVTSLDPDAPMRQDRTLESQDAFYERAMWIACYEMLRRGKPWGEICDWCEERKEGWRAVAIGRTLATSDAASNMAWRKMCYMASCSETVGDYEAAVYGLLGGNVHAVTKISRSVDDHLYAHYNAVLIRQFDQWIVRNYPQRVPQGLSKMTEISAFDGDRSVVNADWARVAISELINSLRQKTHTKHESVSPMKMLQSYLLSNQAETLIQCLGTAVAGAQSSDVGQGTLHDRIHALIEDGSIDPEACIVSDFRTLRVATHICMVLKGLRRRDAVQDIEILEAEENVTEAYVEMLRAAGKHDLAPVYASRMRKERYKHAMARVMEDVRINRDRQTTLDLFGELEMDTEVILWEHIVLRLSHLQSGEATARGVNILEKTQESDLNPYPGLRIKLDALPADTDIDEDACVDSLQWFQQLKGHWKLAFEALTLSLRTALLTGRFACARAIVDKYPYDIVAHNKSYLVLGHSVNPAADEASRPTTNERDGARWDLMLRQSKVYYQLEQLVRAFEALNVWRVAEAQIPRQDRQQINLSSRLKGPWEKTEDAMAPLMESDFLLDAADEEEAAALEQIRTRYLPEAVISYETVLHCSGHIVTRLNLLKAMELSCAVAKEDGALKEPMVRSGRVGELVTCFARTSKAILMQRGLHKRAWEAPKDRIGREPGIWELGVKECWEDEMDHNRE